MMQIQVSVNGQKQIIDAVSGFNNTFVDRMTRALNLASSLIEGQAKVNTNPNKDTGRLQSSITHKVSQSANRIQSEIGSNVEYAPYLEFGTRPHFPPQAPIMKWVTRKFGGSFDIRTRTSLSGKSQKSADVVRQVAFLISRKMALRGTKAYPYLKPAFETKFADASSIMTNAITNALKGTEL